MLVLMRGSFEDARTDAKGVVPGAPGAPKNAISKATDGKVGIPKAANIPGAKGPLPKGMDPKATTPSALPKGTDPKATATSGLSKGTDPKGPATSALPKGASPKGPATAALPKGADPRGAATAALPKGTSPRGPFATSPH